MTRLTTTMLTAMCFGAFTFAAWRTLRFSLCSGLLIGIGGDCRGFSLTWMHAHVYLYA